jgi:hypothetical protein
MKVYILIYDVYPETKAIMGVFDSREKALNYELQNNHKPNWTFSYEIEEWEIK